MRPPPINLARPPISGLDRLLAHARQKYGRKPLSELAGDLIDEYVLLTGVSFEEATSAPLLKVADALARSASPVRGRHRMTVEEANEKAMDLAKADRFFVQRPLREWAEAIGCSEGTVAKLTLWRETMKATGRGRSGRVAPPKAVSLTGNLEAGIGDEDANLKRLIAEQAADAEPSPREEDQPGQRPRKVRTRKRV
jgi:hypothetical protein